MRYSFFGLFCISIVALPHHYHHHQQHQHHSRTQTVCVNAKWTWSKWNLMSGVKVNNWQQSQQPKWFFIVDHANIYIKMSSRIYLQLHISRTRILPPTINHQPSICHRTNIVCCLFVIPFFLSNKKNSFKLI